MTTRTAIASMLVLALGAGAAGAQPGAGAGPPIEPGSRVQVEYTLSDAAGAVLDSNRGREPLTFTYGQRQIVPGLEAAVRGMRAGEAKRVEIPPADAYGVVDPTAEREVPKDAIPPEGRHVGAQLTAKTAAGETRYVRVKEVKEGTVVLDLNHPLAGKTLYFDVRILEVAPPSR